MSKSLIDSVKERIDSGEMSAFISGGETASLVKAVLNLDEEKRIALQNIERTVGKSNIKMPILTISTGGGTTTYFVAYNGKNIGRDSLWGISPFYLGLISGIIELQEEHGSAARSSI